MLTFIIIVLLVSLFGIVYFRWLRPWQLSWDATDQEVEQVMPGDEIVKKNEKANPNLLLGL